MKEETVEQLPGSWFVCPIGEVLDTVTGATPSKKKAEFYGGSIPFVKPPDLKDREVARSNDWLTTEGANSARLVPRDSVLVSCIGNLGKSGISQREIAINQQINAVLPRPSLFEPKFILYQVQSWAFRCALEKVASATTIAIVNKSKFNSIPLKLAPLAEQRRIVDKIERLFSHLDEGERLLKQVQKQIATYRQAVLKAAVTGELTKEWRAENKDKLESSKALLQRILEERRKNWQGRGKYKEPVAPDVSGLPELPEGWVWATIEQLFQVFIGSTPSRKEKSYWGGDIPWVSSGEVAFCRIAETREMITDLGYRNSSVKLHPPGTVLLAMIGEGKTRGQAAILDIPACHNQNSASIRVSETPVPPEYIFYLFQHNYEETRLRGQGGSQPALNGQKVKSLMVPLPPKKEIFSILSEVANAMNAAAQLETAIENELNRTQSTKQAILKSAFSGKLVPQDPSDEPASGLLERIQEEQQRESKSKPTRGRNSKKGVQV